MMSSAMGAPYQAGGSPMYPMNFMTDEMSRQLALSSDSMRLASRGSTGQRTQNAMRVVKPSSASNSPQNMLSRRSTLVNDGNLAKRRQQALEYALAQQMQGPSPTYSSYPEPAKRTSRPVSWHPSSHLQQSQAQMPMQQHIPQPDFSHYVFPLPTPYTQADMYTTTYTNLPPTPVVYSGQTSAVNAYSPLSYPFTMPSQPQAQASPQYVSRGAWEAPQEVSPSQYAAERSPTAGGSFSSSSTGQSYFNLDTSNNLQMLSQCNAPPTPDDIQPAQQPQPMVPAEDSIPFQPLEEPEEEEGEILIGMGLYDAPDKTDTDPELDNYRTSASYLLGTTYRRGQGLKLEEAWEPPPSDDEDDSEDAEGEEQE